MKRNCYLILWLVLLMGVHISNAFSQVREWTSVDGRKLQAEYGGTQGTGPETKVRLIMGEGKSYLYPIAKLSPQDREFVKRILLSAGPSAQQVRAIDGLVFNRLKASHGALNKELAKLPANQNLTEEEKQKRKVELEKQLKMCIPNQRTSDHQFLRRVYLDIAGRIPSFNEANRFLQVQSPGKRAKLIDELLDSDAYTMRMYNYLSDLLRVREKLVMSGSNLKADPYIEWLKKCVGENKPWDEMVREMIAAEGTVWDNPASSYLTTDFGMTLCNLSNSFTIFLGAEITCAQCHDHPYEDVSQMDFYRLATFMGKVRMRGSAVATVDIRKKSQSELKRLNQILDNAGLQKSKKKGDPALADRKGSFVYWVAEGKKQSVALPHDYKYDDGSPNQELDPATYFGDEIKAEKFDSPREAYAHWMTSRSNPRFTANLVNRLWKLAFGYAQIEPVDNLPEEIAADAQNPELLRYLERMMQDMNFRIKDFLRVIYNTEAYQRQAEEYSPSLTQISKGTYHFPGPNLRRMSAEQIWDSLFTLTTDQPEAVKRKGWNAYRELMNYDTTKLKTVEDIVGFTKRWDKIGQLSGVEIAPKAGKKGRRGTVSLIARASELKQPQRDGHFLRMFGQSDKQLIEGQYSGGSSPQIMSLINGVITNDVLSNPKSWIIEEIAQGEGRDEEKIDYLFLSILCRDPFPDEVQTAKKIMNVRKAEGGDAAKQAGDVIWALINTREFLFIQ